MLLKPEDPQGPSPHRRRRVHPAAMRTAGGLLFKRRSEPVRERVMVRGDDPVAIGIAVVDTDTLTRDGITAIVGRQHDMRVMAIDADVAAALTRLPSTARPDVVLVDAWRASEDEGAAVRSLMHALPGTKIIAFGAGRCEEEAFRLLNAGAAGYVMRGAIKAELVAAIRLVQGGGRYVPAEIQRLLTARERRPPLTPRERGVLELLAQARSNATIAAVLGISVGTVKLHVKAILAKLGVEDRAEAALVAMVRGFARLPGLGGV